MIEVYTDAAFHPVHKVGGYGVVIKQYSKMFVVCGEIKKVNNPTESEMIAIDHALREIIKLKLHDTQLMLYTDCKFAIHATNRGKDKTEKNLQKLWKRVQRRTGAICRMQYIKAHSGNVYNEQCDSLAKTQMWRLIDQSAQPVSPQDQLAEH